MLDCISVTKKNAYKHGNYHIERCRLHCVHRTIIIIGSQSSDAIVSINWNVYVRLSRHKKAAHSGTVK